jgi:hypothetical protein
MMWPFHKSYTWRRPYGKPTYWGVRPIIGKQHVAMLYPLHATFEGSFHSSFSRLTLAHIILEYFTFLRITQLGGVAWKISRTMHEVLAYRYAYRRVDSSFVALW